MHKNGMIPSHPTDRPIAKKAAYKDTAHYMKYLYDSIAEELSKYHDIDGGE